ncbi:MAG: hypothetical protein WC609_03555 [Candidatus Paceibacterota bacterium]|jgi:hypothetical protein
MNGDKVRGLFEALRTVAQAMVGAELVDGFLLRPLFLYTFSTLLGFKVGIVVGSFVADASFWTMVYVTKRLKYKR